MESIDNGKPLRLKVLKQIKDIKTENLIFACYKALDETNPHIEAELWSHCQSKYSYLLNCSVSKQKTNKNGIVCLYSNEPVFIKLYTDKINFSMFKIEKNDLLMFPDSFVAKYDSDSVKEIIFPIFEKSLFGDGENKYLISLTLKDIYTVEINADSEKEAIDLAYQIGITNFKHLPEENFNYDLLEKNEKPIKQSSRFSLWCKNMLKAEKI